MNLKLNTMQIENTITQIGAYISKHILVFHYNELLINRSRGENLRLKIDK